MYAHRLHVLVSLMLMIAILMPEMQNAQSDVFQYEQKGPVVTERRQYCGNSLAEVVRMVCHSVYNSRFKRSIRDTPMNDYPSSFGHYLHPYKSIENARKMFRLRRFSRGIHEECCKKGCSTEELRSYCGAPQ